MRSAFFHIILWISFLILLLLIFKIGKPYLIFIIMFLLFLYGAILEKTGKKTVVIGNCMVCGRKIEADEKYCYKCKGSVQSEKDRFRKEFQRIRHRR